MKKGILIIVVIIVAYGIYQWSSNENRIKNPTLMESLSARLAPVGDSGVSGTATFIYKDAVSPIKVKLELTGTPSGGSHPAHIYAGTCEALGKALYTLENVEGGTSQTLLKDVTRNSFLDGTPRSVIVNLSAVDLGTYVACGEISFSQS